MVVKEDYKNTSLFKPYKTQGCHVSVTMGIPFLVSTFIGFFGVFIGCINHLLVVILHLGRCLLK
jgi:hypothetical protein